MCGDQQQLEDKGWINGIWLIEGYYFYKLILEDFTTLSVFEDFCLWLQLTNFNLFKL